MDSGLVMNAVDGIITSYKFGVISEEETKNRIEGVLILLDYDVQDHAELKGRVKDMWRENK